MARPIQFFGSSFNPPTKAHLALVQHMVEEAKKQNPRPIILLAPVYKHIFSKPDLAEFDPRLAITRHQFEDEINAGDVIVSNIEQIVYQHHYQIALEEQLKINPNLLSEPDWDKKDWAKKVSIGTVDVLNHLKAHPELFKDLDLDTTNISLVLGADTYNDFMAGKWKKADEIIGICTTIHVFDRDGLTPAAPAQIVETTLKIPELDETRKNKLAAIKTAIAGEPQFGGKFKLHENVITDPAIKSISSTKIRNEIKDAIIGLVPKVLDLIRKEHRDLFKSTREENKVKNNK